MNKRTTLTVAVLATAALGLTACGGSGSDSKDKIKIGIKYDQPGMGFKDGDKFTGFDVDVAKYVAKELGYPEDKIQFVEAVSAQRENMLKSNQVKLVVGTYSITDKRKKDVDFAGPYYIAGQDLLVRADDSSITGPDSLSGKKLCSVKGSTSATKIKEKVPGVNLMEYATYSLCVEGLKQGAVDALTTDDTILAGYAAQDVNKGKLKVVGKTFSEEKYGIGIKKGDKDLCNKVTNAIKKMIQDGSWQKYIDSNLGPSQFKPGPGNPPTPAACS